MRLLRFVPLAVALIIIVHCPAPAAANSCRLRGGSSIDVRIKTSANNSSGIQISLKGKNCVHAATLPSNRNRITFKNLRLGSYSLNVTPSTCQSFRKKIIKIRSRHIRQKIDLSLPGSCNVTKTGDTAPTGPTSDQFPLGLPTATPTPTHTPPPSDTVIVSAAVCDGITEDTAVIRNEILRATAVTSPTSRATIKFPRGVCRVGSSNSNGLIFQLPNNIILSGSVDSAGHPLTTFKYTDAIIYNFAQVQRFLRMFAPLPSNPTVTNIKIENLILDGGWTPDQQFEVAYFEQRHAIYIREATNFVVSNVHIFRFRGDGIYIHSSYKDGAIPGVLVQNISSQENGRNALTFGGTKVAVPHDVIVEDSIFTAVPGQGSGIDFEPASLASEHEITDITIRRSTVTGANSFGVNSNLVLEDNTIYGSADFIGARNAVIRNNSFYRGPFSLFEGSCRVVNWRDASGIFEGNIVSSRQDASSSHQICAEGFRGYYSGWANRKTIPTDATTISSNLFEGFTDTIYLSNDSTYTVNSNTLLYRSRAVRTTNVSNLSVASNTEQQLP